MESKYVEAASEIRSDDGSLSTILRNVLEIVGFCGVSDYAVEPRQRILLRSAEMMKLVKAVRIETKIQGKEHIHYLWVLNPDLEKPA